MNETQRIVLRFVMGVDASHGGHVERCNHTQLAVRPNSMTVESRSKEKKALHNNLEEGAYNAAFRRSRNSVLVAAKRCAAQIKLVSDSLGPPALVSSFVF